MEKVNYKKYITSNKWISLRRIIKEYNYYNCQLCGHPNSLEVHHMTYARLGHEHPDDLITLCRDCHQLAHDNNGVKLMRLVRSWWCKNLEAISANYLLKYKKIILPLSNYSNTGFSYGYCLNDYWNKMDYSYKEGHVYYSFFSFLDAINNAVVLAGKINEEGITSIPLASDVDLEIFYSKRLYMYRVIQFGILKYD